MNHFENDEGRTLVTAMVEAIQANSVLLSDLDGVIGDGDHGINMNKGFTVTAERLTNAPWDLTTGLEVLSAVLLDEIGGAMGPLYGTFFGELARVSAHGPIDALAFGAMLRAGLDAVRDLGGAQVGDKTLVDTLAPACDAFDAAVAGGRGFAAALDDLARAAEQGKESTRELVAKVGRSSRLGERSRGLLDAGAVSCWLLLRALSQASQALLVESPHQQTRSEHAL